MGIFREEECVKCYWYHFGSCHINPPTVVYNTSTYKKESQFPRVNKDDFCAKFKKSEK